MISWKFTTIVAYFLQHVQTQMTAEHFVIRLYSFAVVVHGAF